MNRIGITAWIAIALGLSAAPALADEIALDWWTIDGGGGVGTVQGGAYALSGTIGQPDAGRPMVGGAYQLQGGFWSGELLVTTDVAEPNAEEDPSAGSSGYRFRAQGSAPNPFRSQVTVSFELPDRQAVELFVFDPSGRRCRTLFQGGLEAGRHGLSWNGRDDEGNPVAAGVYFVVLRAPAGDLRQKLVKIH